MGKVFKKAKKLVGKVLNIASKPMQIGLGLDKQKKIAQANQNNTQQILAQQQQILDNQQKAMASPPPPPPPPPPPVEQVQQATDQIQASAIRAEKRRKRIATSLAGATNAGLTNLSTGV